MASTDDLSVPKKGPDLYIRPGQARSRRRAEPARRVPRSGFMRQAPHGGIMASVEEVKKRYEARLMKTPGVVGVGIGRSGGKPVIRVYVEKDTPKVRKAVPDALEDVPVEIVVSGPFKAL